MSENSAGYAAQLATIIGNHDNIVVAAHANPDGDAIGATGAMAHILSMAGKKFAIYNFTGVPEYLRWVPLPQKMCQSLHEIPFHPGLLVILDCGDQWRVGREMADILYKFPSVNIDHHLGNPNFASLSNWVDPGMAATGQMVAAIADAMQIPLADDLAACIYLSLVADTGSFTHSNTGAAVFRLAARLLENGLDASAIREKLDNQWTLAKSRLWGRLFAKLHLEHNGAIAVCAMPLAEIEAEGAKREDLEGFVEQMRHIRGVRVALLVRGDPGNRCKFSLRSGGHDDVRAVAAHFGGGGHRNAAGATVAVPIAKFVDEAVSSIARLTLHEEA